MSIWKDRYRTIHTFAQKLPVANTRVRCAKILIYFEIH
jgi:hypothetical protein